MFRNSTIFSTFLNTARFGFSRAFCVYWYDPSRPARMGAGKTNRSRRCRRRHRSERRLANQSGRHECWEQSDRQHATCLRSTIISFYPVEFTRLKQECGSSGFKPTTTLPSTSTARRLSPASLRSCKGRFQPSLSYLLRLSLNWRSLEVAGFIQDVIRVNPRLEVRVGLRIEGTNGWNEAHGRAANYLFDSNHVIETNPRVARFFLHHQSGEAPARTSRRIFMGPSRQR